MTNTIKNLNLPVFTFQTGQKARRFSVWNTTFKDFDEVSRVYHYSGSSGRGEQRGVVTPHVNNLKKAMNDGTFVPTPLTVSVGSKIAPVFHEENGTVDIAVNLEEKERLHVTDGQQRSTALRQLREEANASFESLQQQIESAKAGLAKATADNERSKFQALIKALEEKSEQSNKKVEQIDNTPITTIVLLDGDTQIDFVALQQGRPVDTAHMLSMRIRHGLFANAKLPSIQKAFEVAKILNKEDDGPYEKTIRFDSTSAASSVLPVTTLCSQSASDIGTSLVGLARIANTVEPNKDEDWCVKCIRVTYDSLLKNAPHLVSSGGTCCPPNTSEWTRGSASMLIGLANLLAYKSLYLGQAEPEDTNGELASYANAVMPDKVEGNYSGPVKRMILGRIAKMYLGDVNRPKHEEVPIDLIESLSSSTLGVSKLPKPPKAKKSKKND